MKRADLEGLLERPEIVEGAVFRGAYPFVREPYTQWTEEGDSTRISWRPGVSMEIREDGDTDALAHGMGEIVLTVVSLHKPAHYPKRVFFTRQWRDPDGRLFGKPRLRVSIERAFRLMASGYRHSFYIDALDGAALLTQQEASDA